MLLNVIIGLVISAAMISLIIWLKVAIEKRAKATLPERRRKALEALAQVVNGHVDDMRLTGIWDALPVEARSEIQPDAPRWKIVITLPPGGVDWRLVDISTLGYMFHSGDWIDIERALPAGGRKAFGQALTKEEINKVVDLKMAFREAHARQLEQGAALVSRLGPLAGALQGNLENDASFGLPGDVSYEAESGRLTYEALVYSEADFPTPQQFTDELKMLTTLRDLRMGMN